MSSSGVTVVLGGQWGDEGKGKLVDLLSIDADYVCRCQGGNNAGHTVITNSSSQPYFFHLLPSTMVTVFIHSGIINPNCISVIGNGVVVHLKGLFDEIEENEKKGLKGWQDRLRISARAHIVFDFHQQIDEFLEQEKGKESLGTTKKGIGPTYAAKCSRSGVRVCDLYADPAVLRRKLDTLITGYSKRYSGLRVDLDEEMKKCQHYAERIKPMVCDTVTLVNRAIKAEKNVIVEGANATMLDIDFGTYPFVTSSNCSAGVVCTGLGIPPRHVGKVYGVMKAYTTRVGVGAFPTQLDDEVGETLQRVGREFGVTTGRKRRCGWFDMVVARYSCMINGFTSIAISKLDIMDTLEEVKIGVAYKLDGKLLESMPPEQTQLEHVEVEYVTLPGWKTSTSCLKSFSDLHPNAQAYINKLAELLEVPIQWVGTGPSREDMIQLF